MFLCSPVYQDSGAWLLCWLCCERFYLHWHHTQWASLLSCRQPEHLQNAQGPQHHFGRLMFLYITFKLLEVWLYFSVTGLRPSLSFLGANFRCGGSGCKTLHLWRQTLSDIIQPGETSTVFIYLENVFLICQKLPLIKNERVCLFHLTGFCVDRRLLRPPPDFGLPATHPQCCSLHPCTGSPPFGVLRQTDRQLSPASVDQWKISEPKASETLRQGHSGRSNQHKSWGHSPLGACWRWPDFFHSIFIAMLVVFWPVMCRCFKIN